LLVDREEAKARRQEGQKKSGKEREEKREEKRREEREVEAGVEVTELKELKDPVKLLVEMARRGEIDPWNIDVVEVADRFLEELERAKKLDLRISGRVLLYAAILVRMKAEILAEEAIFQSGEAEEAEVEMAMDVSEDVDDIYPDIDHIDPDFDSLPDYYGEFDYSGMEEIGEIGDVSEEDEVIAYLMRPHRKVRRFTTLKDLLMELKKAESVKKKKKRSVEDVRKKILETPHEEDMEETINRVERELERLFERKGMLLFSELVRGKKRGEMLSYYVSLLYLSFRKKVEIEQERIYEDDIIVRKFDG